MSTFQESDYVASELNSKHRALRELDLQFIRNWTGCESLEVAMIIAHKVRFETTSLEDQLRHESRDWLEARGYNRFKQIPWPLKGELPSGTTD